MADLQPCPFCGKTRALKLTTAEELANEGEDDPLPWQHSESWAVICDGSKPLGPGGCGASGGFMPSQVQAVDLWNKRAPGVTGTRKCLYCSADMIVDSECTSAAQAGQCDVYQQNAATQQAPVGVMAVDPLNDRSRDSDDRLRDAPTGTRAPAIGGGAWCKVAHGWKWNGPNGGGGTFPRPGGDWTGKLVLEQAWLDANPHHARTYGVAVGDGQTFSRHPPMGESKP